MFARLACCKVASSLMEGILRSGGRKPQISGINSTPSVSEIRQPGNRDRKGIPRVEPITGDVNIHSVTAVTAPRNFAYPQARSRGMPVETGWGAESEWEEGREEIRIGWQVPQRAKFGVWRPH